MLENDFMQVLTLVEQTIKAVGELKETTDAREKNKHEIQIKEMTKRHGKLLNCVKERNDHLNMLKPIAEEEEKAVLELAQLTEKLETKLSFTATFPYTPEECENLKVVILVSSI